MEFSITRHEGREEGASLYYHLQEGREEGVSLYYRLQVDSRRRPVRNRPSPAVSIKAQSQPFSKTGNNSVLLSINSYFSQIGTDGFHFYSLNKR